MDAPTPVTHTLLLVETDSALADATIVFLETLGHAVQHALNGREALALIATRGIPDFILTNFHLNCRLNGVELIERLRLESGRVIPAIIMTGDTSLHCRGQVDRLARCTFFTKPVNSGTLARAIDGT